LYVSVTKHVDEESQYSSSGQSRLSWEKAIKTDLAVFSIFLFSAHQMFVAGVAELRVDKSAVFR